MIRAMNTRSAYQAKLAAPFGVLGIRCEATALTGIEFLAPGVALQAPDNPLARAVYEQLEAFFADPDFRFDLPLRLGGTAHQNKVWQAMCAIPRGQVRQYGELAAQLGSSPRAVGQACGSNPVPIIIPCHRVVSKSGMGGFMNRSGGYALDIKHWLLAHEGATKPEPAIPAQSLPPRRREAGIQPSKSAGFLGKPGMAKPK
ncbi:MAG: methylated-DNA--[protein]-cysteine S-methyltransferase [Nitrosomonadales bacterium]|nr:methylated-DNA--[protein]-cysteine S-methyltransferase [Nitrosomonadales bacterium]